MKIYTKTGDQGETCLYDGSRTTKDDARLDLIGDLDELSANLALVHSLHSDIQIQDYLLQIIHDIFILNAHLAGAKNFADLELSFQITALEQSIDLMTAELSPLTNFIYPIGSQAIAVTHISRTICRKAERKLVRASRDFTFACSAQAYLNRLSDWLFTLARFIAHNSAIAELALIV